MPESKEEVDRMRGGKPPLPGHESREIQRHIADDDKKARTGKDQEPVRDTPPAGEWNDTA